MRKPLVSIVIVTYNSSEYIKVCLESLLAITYKPHEIVVMDNSSTDNTKDILSKYEGKINIFSSKNVGFAEGVNKAVRKAEGKYVFLINPDTKVSQGFLQPLVAVMEANNKVAACQPLIYLMKKKKTINLTGKTTQYLGFDWIKDYKEKIVPERHEISSFSGSGVMIRKSIFSKCGGFDPIYFMYHEDTDLSWKFRLLGYKLLFIPESVIYHDYKYIPKESYHPLKNKLKYYERNRLTTIIKNYQTKTLMLLSPIIITIEFAMLAFSILQGWFLQKLQGYGHIIKNARKIRASRLFIQKKRVVSDKELVNSFKAGLYFKEFQIFPVKYIVNPLLSIYWTLIRIFI